MTIRYRILLSMTVLAFAACGPHGNTPAQVQADAAKAQADGQKKVDDANAELARVQQENSTAPANPAAPNTMTEPTAPADRAKKIADAEYDVAKAKAQQTYDVAVARCGNRTGDDLKACKELAKSNFDRSMAEAKSRNDEAHRLGANQPNSPPANQ